LGVDDGRREWMTDDLPRQKHLALYNEVDLVLDTFPFSGATSTYEALWMGVPVVTLLGDSMVARWSAAILDTVGHAELIARTTEEYVAKAVALATDPDRLRRYHETLRDRVARSAVCDGAARARQIERVFRAAWRQWCAAASS
jgi:protein O-GlcNAc transferase